ncbi:MAG: hypothetical protein K8I27_08955 [Planctomycetes bacterium]|nr:hypothetical protein [Planctomycetota bacterium]
MKPVLTLLIALLLTACGGGEGYFRLEEYGEGWKLDIKEEGEAFRASWVEGENRSLKLVGYADAPGSDYYILNTLYLELDGDGRVVDGRLKRIVLPEFEMRTYYEQNAQWFRVLEGSVQMDADLSGAFKVRCEGGYEFDARIQPISDLQAKRPEKR